MVTVAVGSHMLQLRAQFGSIHALFLTHSPCSAQLAHWGVIASSSATSVHFNSAFLARA
eukprot:CAMPEP_0119335254 /NCGR_PEP_ID=MMETSP1333-20130426/89152_1 /TAXON_ID=418940 /ORGANISM="Scyphosphaera apsteinii, Strain RCC1455" /LENGTH=58 /DNA_ID=CAMNT_0007345763 /DNA_START=154 /DNA_END=326 /DNA_ORIENTATION=-